MSVTTTENPTTYTLQSTLADYDLHHSGDVDTSLNAHPTPSAQNPSDWPTEHRRIPEYRPVNRELDQSERRVYLNPIEQVFVGVMFTGVFLESVRIPPSKVTILQNMCTNIFCRRYQRPGGQALGGYGTWDTRLEENGDVVGFFLHFAFTTFANTSYLYIGKHELFLEWSFVASTVIAYDLS
jgi:hypothetical protein